MNNLQLAPHEAIEVREFVSQEIIGIKKINASINIANDMDLKSYMQDSIAAKATALKNIQTVVGMQS